MGTEYKKESRERLIYIKRLLYNKKRRCDKKICHLKNRNWNHLNMPPK